MSSSDLADNGRDSSRTIGPTTLSNMFSRRLSVQAFLYLLLRHFCRPLLLETRPLFLRSLA